MHRSSNETFHRERRASQFMILDDCDEDNHEFGNLTVTIKDDVESTDAIPISQEEYDAIKALLIKEK